MKYRKLGSSGLLVSEIAFGTMAHGGAQYKFTDNPVTEEESLATLKRSIELGINYIDCADIYGAYGNAERIIGKFMKDYDRSDFVVSSKVNFPMSNRPTDRGMSRKHIVESIDKTLERLDTDYLDIYYSHRYDYSTPLEETVETMNQLIDSGKVLYWATSNWFASSLERAYGIARARGMKGPVVDQSKYNMYKRFDAEWEFPYTAALHGFGVVAYKVLSDGIFTGKYLRGSYSNLTEDEIKHLSSNMVRYNDQFTEDEYNKLVNLNEIAKELELSMPQLSYAFVLDNKIVSSAIMSTRKPDRIDEVVKASEISLSDDTIKKINEIMAPAMPYRFYDSYPYYKRVMEVHPGSKSGVYPPDPQQF